MGGISGILPSEIVGYLSWQGFTSRDEQEYQFGLVNRLDMAFLKHYREKADATQKAKK